MNGFNYAEQYKTIVDAVNSIILRLDTSGKILFINAFGEAFFGYEKQEIVGRNLIGTLAPRLESSGRDLSRLVESITQNPNSHAINENENVKKDGSRVWVLWTNKAVLDEKGRVVEILSVGNEITHRKKAEMHLMAERDELATEVQAQSRELDRVYEDLRYEVVESRVKDVALSEHEVKYRSIVEGSIEGIFQTTEDGRYILANASLAHMLGYESAREFMSMVTNVEPNLYADQEARKEYKRILAAEGRVKGFETQFYKKDGTAIWVSLNVRTVRDQFGGLICFEGAAQDITRRKRDEEQLRQSFERLQRVMKGTIKALSRAIELRDPYTAGHQARVALLTAAIAKEMGFTHEHTDAVYVAALLHDIGKIYVPSEILTRPGKVSEHEFAVLRDHCQAGYEILKDVEFDYDVAQIVLQHHERLNGTGYPQGLSADQICADARIIGTADVIESMMSHRPYRPSLGISEAMKELQLNKGILYDEKIVGVCEHLFYERSFSFET